MHVLLVKLSSMGDLIHTLPALSDARAAVPDITFDWVIDQSFHEIAQWHPAIKRAIISDHRVWKRQPIYSLRNGQIKNFLFNLRRSQYDLVLDGQASIKSSIITGLSRGPKAGFDAKSVREYGANWAYQHHFRVKKDQHAIVRLRQLFASALGYEYPTSKADFNLVSRCQPAESNNLTKKPYLVFLTNTTWPSKFYSEAYWQALIEKAGNNYHVYLPWGTADEFERVKRLAKTHNKAIVLPHLSLSQTKALIENADGAISVDTGLGHLAIALNTPTLILFGPTDPTLVGAVNDSKSNVQASDFTCLNCYQRQCNYPKKTQQESTCLLELTPDIVWEKFSAILQNFKQNTNNSNMLIP